MKNLHQTFLNLETTIEAAIHKNVQCAEEQLIGMFLKAKKFGIIGPIVGWMPNENCAGIVDNKVEYHTIGLFNEKKLELIENAAKRLTETIAARDRMIG